MKYSKAGTDKNQEETVWFTPNKYSYSQTISNLKPGASYTFTVVAWTSGAVGVASEESDKVTGTTSMFILFPQSECKTGMSGIKI